MVIKFLNIILFLVIPLSIFGQKSYDKIPKDSLKIYKKSIKRGNIYYENFEYEKAIKEFEIAYNIIDTNFILNFKLGVGYLYENNQKKSTQHLQKAYNLKNNDTTHIEYYLASAHQNNFKFDTAIFYYQKYIPFCDSASKVIIENRIIECNNGIGFMKDTNNYVIKNIGEKINSKYTDYGFYILPSDTIAVFTSKRPENIGGYINPYDGEYYEDLFFIQISNSEFSNSYNPKRPINTEDPDACVGVSSKKDIVYIYSAINQGDIFYTFFNGEKWEKPVNFRLVNSIYKETSIAFSQNDEYIYFTSQRPEAIGGLDIFFIKKITDSTYSKPVNLGENINTSLDEDCIYISPNNDTLYFSSKGHNSMGGYDVFCSVRDENGDWQKAVNLGYPVNSPYDDMYFRPYKNKFIFSTIRDNSVGKHDIYLVNEIYHEPKIESFELLVKVTNKSMLNNISGKINIIDKNTRETIIIQAFADGKYENILESDNDYTIEISADNYLLSSYDILQKETNLSSNVEIDVCLIESPVVFLSSFKIYFGTNKTKIDDEFKTGLDSVVSILNEYPNIELEIAGHTDSIGSFEYNEELADKRAKNIFDYLTQNGIAESRFIYKSYSFSKAIATENTDKNKKLNRRVEFYIIEQ